MGLFDGLLGGGGAGSADDPYADILTPAQRNQMQVQGLLAMAGAFAQAGMPSRLPVPFGSALGSAAAALGTGQEAGMKTAIENALAAQKVRDLRAKAGILAKLNPLFQQALDAADNPVPAPSPAGPGVSLGPPGAGVRPSGAAPAAAPAAGGPLMMDRSLLYPEPPAAGGLLGSDVGAKGEYGTGQEAGGLLGPAPPADQRAALPSGPAANSSGRGLLGAGDAGDAALSQDAAAAEVARLDAAYAARNPDASPAAKAAMHTEYVIFVNRPPTERGGSSTAPAEPDPGAGGDGWGPTFPQQAASRTGPARGETPEMTRLIERAAAERGVSPDVLRGLIKVESGFKPNIVSPAGAVGLAQLMPRTARGLGVTDPTDPTQAIPAAAQYLRQGLDAQGGDINRALMYYHGGPNTAMWGPKTQAYPGAVLAAAGGAPALTTQGSGGGGEDAGWGPTFAQGGPDRVIPSGAGGAPAATLAQYAPGGTAVPGMPQLAAPSSLPGLAAPSTLPPLAAAGAAPALGAGGKIPGLNMTPQKLAIIDAMAEAAGLGNPFKGLLDTYYKSPGYLQESAGAQERGRIAESEPSQLRVQAAKARSDLIQKLAESGLTLDQNGKPVVVPGMPEMLGLAPGAIELAKQEAAAKLKIEDTRVIGPDGQPTIVPMPAYEKIWRLQQQAKNAAMGAKPQPGDIIGAPIAGTVPEGYQLRTSPQGGLTAQPIPGTPAEQVVKDRERKQAVSDQANLVARDIMVQNTNRIEDLVQNSTLPVTGTTGPFLSRIGGTAANDVRVMVETMKARASLDQLNQMRNSNPTGAGLGNVSNAEGDRLAAAIANLDQSQTKEQFLFNLRRLRQEYVDIVHGPGTYSKLSDEPVLKVPVMGATRPAPAIGTVQDGHSFKGGNPADPNNWQKVP